MAVPCGDERDYALLTRTKRNAGNKKYFSNVDISKEPQVLKTIL
jgi:hypothetical protein